jgi:uncharacterized protein YggE
MLDANQPKHNFLNLSIVVTLFSFFILSLLVGGSVVYFQYLRYKSDAKTSKIDIVGVAEKKIKYDKLTMGFVISKSGTDASELNKQVDELTIKAQDILSKNSIKKENIQSSKNSYPDYNDQFLIGTAEQNKEKKTVFENRFTVKIEDLQNNLSLPNNLTKALTAIGINQFDPYSYAITNERAVCDELKTTAIKDAREKGNTQIKAIGGTEVVSTQILSGGDNCAAIMYPIAYGVADKFSLTTAPSQVTAPEVVTGEKNITQEVSVTFEYR